jgi:hypothetical protein
MANWPLLLFGAFHTLLGLTVFGFVTYMMLGEKGDDADGGSDDGGGGQRPKPWRPGPSRPRRRRGPERAPSFTPRPGPAGRISRQPR